MDCRTCNLKYLLGLQMFEEGLRCPLCHAVANPFGDHQVDCGGNRERILRHNSFGYAVFSVSCLGAPKGSPLSSPRHPEPACWHLPPLLEKGLPSRFDVTVISTWQQSTIRGAAKNQGDTLLFAKERKFASHGAAWLIISIPKSQYLSGGEMHPPGFTAVHNSLPLLTCLFVLFVLSFFLPLLYPMVRRFLCALFFFFVLNASVSVLY